MAKMLITARKVNHQLLNALPEHYPNFIKRILAAREIQSSQDIEYHLSALIPTSSLKNIDQACDLLVHAIQSNHSICIIGDYDADGATSTALLLTVLKQIGAHQTQYYTLNRFEDGYNISAKLIDDIHRRIKPDLIITTDVGTSCHEGLMRASELGCPTLVIDHHLPSETLPNASVIVNPNQPDCPFPSKYIAGVGVAFYVMMALIKRLKTLNRFNQTDLPEPDLSPLLEWVALGTLADVMPLDRNNRILVYHGLRRIQQGQCSLALLAMMRIAKIQFRCLSCTDLAFLIVPRLNSAGRLASMSLGVKWLLSENLDQARHYAEQLSDLNLQRQTLEKDITQSAIQMASPHLEAAGIVLFDPSWHNGLNGIIAGRIKDHFHKPAIVLSPDQNNPSLLKGSGRTPRHLDLHHILSQLQSNNSELIESFGGHKKAIGLNLKKSNLIAFRKAFNEAVKRQGAEISGTVSIETDGELKIEEMCLSSARWIQQTSPWGERFDQPCFHGVFTINHVISRPNSKHLSFTASQGDNRYQLIAFNQASPSWFSRGQRTKLVYQLHENHYQGRSQLQLLVKYIDKAPV